MRISYWSSDVCSSDLKKRFSEEQIIGFLREAEAGLSVKELCRKHGFSEASYYLWRSKFGGMSVPDAKRLKELETENGRLKKLLAEQVLENERSEEHTSELQSLMRISYAVFCLKKKTHI